MNPILEHYLFDAFSNCSDNIFIYVSDVKNHITRWSAKAVEYFGLDDQYMTDTATKWMEYIHPDDRELYIEDITGVLSGRTAYHNCQYRARSRFGEYVWVECRGTTLRDEKGEIIAFAGLMTRMDYQIKYDNLTHLMTIYELQQQDFSKMNGSLLLIGVDNFRVINSQNGMVYGNKLLVYLSELLVGNASGYKVYRFQNDEFIVIAPENMLDEINQYAAKIRTICSENNVENEIRPFSISAGIVDLSKCEDDFTDIIAKAETTITYAKEYTTSHIAVYSEEVAEKQCRRNLVAEALVDSIKNDFKGFELYYQPIVANNNESIVACESLLRWNPDNQEVGNCYPGEFIPILEKNGGIINVGYFVMREAIRQAAEWQRQGRTLSVSFNVSYIQLEDEKFIPSLIETAKLYDVDTSKIVVELTESVFASDTILVKKSFADLHSNGFKIALDDFGTGNSSFWMLHNLDVDIIKLDQAFIRGLAENDNNIDYAIVGSVAYMCSMVKYKTVAEGVENQKVWDKISEFNFSGLQGYNFSRPVPVKEFENFMDKYLCTK